MTTPGGLQHRIKEAWTRGAAVYDADPGHGLLLPRVESAWGVVLGESLGPEPLKVLDVGAGTGFLSVMVAKLGHDVTGIDLTPAMLDQARARAAEAGVAIAWREGDAQEMPFPDDAFDAVISRHVLWTMPEPALALREWTRVTQPGGRVLWFDTIMPRPAWLDRPRREVARLVRALSRRTDHAEPHHYHADMYDQLPLRGLTTWEPLPIVAREAGLPAPNLRLLPALTRAERSALPLDRRVGSRSKCYVGSIIVPRRAADAAGER
jgi:ubiquinone/menaquinone biosynthesis C-methylase UbiE